MTEWKIKGTHEIVDKYGVPIAVLADWQEHQLQEHARLIAAAPELLGALKAIVFEADSLKAIVFEADSLHRYAQVAGHMLAVSSGAIDKAEGRQ